MGRLYAAGKGREMPILHGTHALKVALAARQFAAGL